MTNSFEDLSYTEMKDLLRQWRENNERRSEDVVAIGEYVVYEDLKKLGNEKHVVLEQVFLAALDCHHYTLANYCVILLNQEFPESLRVLRHMAASLEAEEKYDEALETLDRIIKSDETNAPARKRRIAVLKAQGLITEAVKELIDYLKKFMSDVEAWQELSELYLQCHEYSKAAFCVEEQLLHQPHNHLVHQRLADIRYTMGGVDNLELAKSYYCQAIKLNPENMRAILGLFLTASALSQQYKSSGAANKRREALSLCELAATASGHDDLPRLVNALSLTE